MRADVNSATISFFGERWRDKMEGNPPLVSLRFNDPLFSSLSNQTIKKKKPIEAIMLPSFPQTWSQSSFALLSTPYSIESNRQKSPPLFFLKLLVSSHSLYLVIPWWGELIWLILLFNHLIGLKVVSLFCFSPNQLPTRPLLNIGRMGRRGVSWYGC